LIATAWPERPLGEVCEVLSGFAWPSRRFSDSGDLPVVRIRDVVRGRSTTFFRGTYDAKYVVGDGDLLVGMDGEFNRARWRGGTALLNQRVCRITVTSSKLDERYLFHFLGTALQALESETPFVTVKHLSVPRVKGIGVPLPPIEEQGRIAAVLDKVDELRSKRRAALALLDTVTESIFLDMFGDPLSSLRDGVGGVLGDAVDFVGGGTPSRSVDAYYSGDISWATSKDMKGAFLDDTLEHITQEAINASATKLVPVGAVLVVVKSKVLAHTLPVAVSRVATCFGQDLKGLIPREGWTSQFVAASLRVAKPWLLQQARGVNTEGLTLDHLRACPINPASVAEQAEFVRRTDEAVRLSGLASAAADQMDELFTSLQQRAFRGEL
jgi:type I restriction enzyme S subunit